MRVRFKPYLIERSSQTYVVLLTVDSCEVCWRVSFSLFARERTAATVDRQSTRADTHSTGSGVDSAAWQAFEADRAPVLGLVPRLTESPALRSAPRLLAASLRAFRPAA